jgi:hypothetical protein
MLDVQLLRHGCSVLNDGDVHSVTALVFNFTDAIVQL